MKKSLVDPNESLDKKVALSSLVEMGFLKTISADQCLFLKNTLLVSVIFMGHLTLGHLIWECIFFKDIYGPVSKLNYYGVHLFYNPNLPYKSALLSRIVFHERT